MKYAYVGESTMAALGVSRPSGRPPPDADRVGMIWVTADRRLNEGKPGGPVVARMLCMEFPDDGGEISAMTNFPVVDSWQPPGLLDSNELATAVPWQLMPVGLGVVLLIAVSLIAFRRPGNEQKPPVSSRTDSDRLEQSADYLRGFPAA